MPAFSVNFADVPDREAIPPGDYLVEIAAAEIKTSNGAKTKGQKMLSIQYKVQGGDYGNRTIFDNLQLSGNALWKTKQLFEALFGKGQNEYNMEAEDLVGSQLEVKVTQEVWAEENGGDGETRNRIAKYRALSGDNGEEGLDTLFSR